MKLLGGPFPYVHVHVMWDHTYMARPPIGPWAMTHTVKFRLSKEEHAMLEKIAQGGAFSTALRQMIHEETDRRKKGTR